MKYLLLNPFGKYSENKLLFIGIFFCISGTLAAYYFNARFDGVIDLHFVKKSTFEQILSDVFIVCSILSLLLFLIGKTINSKTRYIDLIVTCLIAKIPFYFATLLNYNNTIYTIGNKILAVCKMDEFNKFDFSDLTTLLLTSIITLFLVIWSITLLYNGFKTATNAKETKHTLFFIIGLFIAEILSKIIILTF